MTRAEADSYIVYPTGFDDFEGEDKYDFTLAVINGHQWGWSVRPRKEDRRAMNRKGEWIWETRGHQQNKSRRYSLEEALELAEKHIDTIPRAGHMNFSEFVAWVKARRS